MIDNHEQQVLNDVKEIINERIPDAKVDFDVDLGVLSVFFTEDDGKKGIEKSIKIVNLLHENEYIRYSKSEVKLDEDGKFRLYDLSYRIK